MDLGQRLFLGICLLIIAVICLTFVPVLDNRIIGGLLLGGLLCQSVGGIVVVLSKTFMSRLRAFVPFLLGVAACSAAITFMQHAGWSWQLIVGVVIFELAWWIPLIVQGRRFFNPIVHTPGHVHTPE